MAHNMFFEFHLTIPHSTPRSNLESLECPTDYGIISHVEIEFRAGAYWLAGVRVRDRAHQLYPTNDGEFFVSHGYVIAFSEAHRFFSPPYTLFFEGYNEDTIYDHTVTLRIGLIRPEETLARLISQIFFGLAESPFETAAKSGGPSG